MRIKDIAEENRPRECMQMVGVDGLSDANMTLYHTLSANLTQ